MEFIQAIDETIEEFKLYLEDDEFSYKANSFNLSIDTSDYEKLQSIDVSSMIKNMILYYFIDENFSKYKKLDEKLSQINFDQFYKKYVENHIPTTMEILEVNARRDGSAITTLSGKRAYQFLGIIDFYDENMKEEERSKIVYDALIKQKEKSVEILFEDDFLKELLCDCDIKCSEEEISTLEVTLYNICTEIYDAGIFTKRKGYLFANCKKEEIENVKKFYKSGCIVDGMSWIKKAYHKLIAMDKDDKKELQSAISALEKIKVYMQDKENLGKNIEKINFSVLDEVDAMAYYDVFEETFKQQKKRYEILVQEDQKGKEKEKNKQVEHMLEKYNIRLFLLPEDIQEILLQTQNLELLEKNIKALHVEEKDMMKKEITEFLMTLSSKKLSFYSYLIDMGYLSKDSLFTYIKNKEKEEKLQENLKIINDENIPVKSPNYKEEILLKEPDILENNKNLLSYYKKAKSDNNFNYLFDSSYFDALDFLLEHDIDLSLLDNHTLSKKEIAAFIQRAQICIALDIDIYTKSGNINRSFLLGKGFYCKEEDLNCYMLYSQLEDENIREKIRKGSPNHINEEINALEEFKKLEAYKREDNLVYEIEGIFISRPKVMRNLTYFYENNQINEDTILQSIIYNSNLNDEQINKIQSLYHDKEKVKK